jgi:hypothetical protein
MSDLITKLNGVTDERTFVEFLWALSEDRRKNADDWQWATIEDFLDASASWAEDTKNGVNAYVLPTNPWKRFADIVHCGKIYE